jgi:hypothetical protein
LSRFREDEEYKIFLFERFLYSASGIIAAAAADAARRPFQDECPQSKKMGFQQPLPIS